MSAKWVSVASYQNVLELKDPDLRQRQAINGGWDWVNDEGKAVRDRPEGCRLPAGEKAREGEASGRVDATDAVHATGLAAVNESARPAKVA